MSLLGLSPKLCLRLLPAQPATQLCRSAALRSFATSPSLHSAAPKPPKRPGLLSRIKWYKADEDAARRSTRGAILTMYEDLPPTYRDREGLPFAKADLTPEEVAKVFGDKIKPEFANHLLRIMHGRRVAGTLEDPAYRPNTARFTAQQREAALRYLRATVPVGETLNQGLRAQDELEQLEKEMAQMKDEGEQESLEQSSRDDAASAQAPVPAAPKEVEPEVVPTANPVYGIGALDRMRARNLARIRAEEKRIEEEEKIKGEAVAGTLEAYVDRGALSPRMEKWMEQGSSGLTEPPKMTPFERFAPSVAFALLLIAASVGYAAVYKAPDSFDRIFPEFTPEFATIATLIGINLLVYALWKVPPMWRFMNNNFMLVVGMPRPITVLTSIFSHQRLGHLTLNMVVLYYIGSRLHDEVGRANFLAIYLSSGAMGFVASLLLHSLQVASLGASGAVLGLTAAYFYLHAWDKFRIMGFPAPPSEGVDGVAFLVAVLAWNLLSMFTPVRISQTDVVSHLGGLFTGAGMVQLLVNIVNTIDGWKQGPAGASPPEGREGAGDAKTGGGEETPAQSGPGKALKKSFDLWGTKHESYE
ncbi:uncharacterized protein DNG_00528 [Cephalotrichum gorgonifer]|uniref:Peptidase S54 rhomboid domain-containing protein n=1 Tax=Cephalotrichum gorgonifer TaxID=2041049 RepID=A0AAE8SQZ0_9PEZI|nr:uncharacterized protein DNG_00528 [Cephalotrichum gorgonifer]